MRTHISRILIFLIALCLGYFLSPSISRTDVAPQTSPHPVAHTPTGRENAEPALETIEEVEHWGEENPTPTKMKLLEIGKGFHGDEILARDGEKWLGLFPKGKELILRPANLKITHVYDPIIDDGKNEKTGKNVDVAGTNKPLFLINHNSHLREGGVLTLFRGLNWNDFYILEEQGIEIYSDALMSIKADFVQSYEMGGKTYWLKVKKAQNREGERILALFLTDGTTSQVLHTVRTETSSGIANEWLGELGILFWVGDLDKDSKPDIYATLNVHYNVEHRVLFLSSEAKNGKLVEIAATFTTTGC